MTITAIMLAILWGFIQVGVNQNLKRKIERIDRQQLIRLALIKKTYQGLFGIDSWAEVEKKAKDSGIDL